MLGYILLYLMVALEIYSWVFLAYIMLCWLPINDSDPILGRLMRFLSALCEPVYGLVLRFLPPLRLGILDFSPLYIFFLIYLLRLLLSRVMVWAAML
ncbi:MAG: YggT family protein [Brevinematales bacterium]|nr:YggT family protein [Brevinematales bacterium]